MRVLHVIETLEFGGAEKVLVELANAMADQCEVTVCCIKRTGELQASLDRRIRVHCMNSGDGNHILLPFKLALLVRGGRFDVVHSHTWGVYIESAFGALLGGARILVHTVHGHYLYYAPGLASQLKRGLRHFVERVLASAHRRIVTVSDAIQEYVQAEVGIPAARLLTIHNGVSGAQSTFRPDRSDTAAVFITVGRLVAVKNYAMLLRAFADVLRLYPVCRLVVVGDGPERGALESLTHELGIAGRVDFLGFRQDVQHLLLEADVFVLSSKYEGISIALLEAMRAGLPAIATRVGGMAEVLVDGETGILVPDDHQEAMAQAMVTLVESPAERRRLGGQGYARMRDSFSMSVIVERYLSVYRA